MPNFLTPIATSIAQNPQGFASAIDASYHPSSNIGDLPLDSPADGSINTGTFISPLKTSTASVGYA